MEPVAAPAADRRRGPVPFREIVLKVHSRCNISCDYCYMYELADQSARTDRAVMAGPTFDRTCRRIAEHVAEHELTSVRVVLHGGEPMLVGAEVLARMADRLRAAAAPATVQITVQTNATLLDERRITTLAGAAVRIGVSLDGDRRANDRHRRYSSGRSSFDAVDRALGLLRQRPETFAGILCVVDLANDPVRTYDALMAYDPPAVDFLLPHANWDTPPPRPAGGADGSAYGGWLVAAFDRWYDEPRSSRVTLFEEVINLLLGGASRTESVGLSPVAVVVVNVDGSYEQVDTLRSSHPGAVGTDLDVFANSLTEVLAHPAIARRQAGAAALAPACLSCPVHPVCGGGNYPHRYRAGSFLNPSVYCADLRLLIEHVAGRLRADVAALRGCRS